VRFPSDINIGGVRIAEEKYQFFFPVETLKTALALKCIRNTQKGVLRS